MAVRSHHDQVYLVPELVVIENRQNIALALTRHHFKTGFLKALMRGRKLGHMFSVGVV